MKTYEHFVKVKIESTDDLPKKKGIYWAKQYQWNEVAKMKLSDKTNFYWLKEVDWYLLPEQSHPIELPSDKEIKYRASLHAGVPCDDPDIYGSHARAIYDECIRIGIWFRDQIKQQLK